MTFCRRIMVFVLISNFTPFRLGCRSGHSLGTLRDEILNELLDDKLKLCFLNLIFMVRDVETDFFAGVDNSSGIAKKMHHSLISEGSRL